MAGILNSAILNLAILDSAILVFLLKLTHTGQDWFPPFAQKNFTHSFWLKLILAAILNSAILNLDILDSAILVFPLKLTHTCQDWFPPFAQIKLHSFILTQLDDGSHHEICHLEFGHLRFSHHSMSSQTHSHFPRLVPTMCTKKLHSFILTQLDDGSHLELCHVGFRHCHLGLRHLVIFSQIHSKTLSLLSDSESN